MSRHGTSLQHALDVLTRPLYSRYIKAIYLYGSCARCSQTYHSDVDLLVIVEQMPQKMMRDLKTEVTPNDYTLPEVELNICDGQIYSSRFKQNIERDGKLLWER